MFDPLPVPLVQVLEEVGDVGDEGPEEEEETGSQAIIILHPGSSTLHLGLSTDPTPHSIPHIIAYRNMHKGRGLRNGNETQSEMESTGQEWKSVDESLVLKYKVDVTVSACILSYKHTPCEVIITYVSIVIESSPRKHSLTFKCTHTDTHRHTQTHTHAHTHTQTARG